MFRPTAPKPGPPIRISVFSLLSCRTFCDTWGLVTFRDDKEKDSSAVTTYLDSHKSLKFRQAGRRLSFFLVLRHLWNETSCMRPTLWLNRTQQPLTDWEQVRSVSTHCGQMWLSERSRRCFLPAQWRPLWLRCQSSGHYESLFAGLCWRVSTNGCRWRNDQVLCLESTANRLIEGRIISKVSNRCCFHKTVNNSDSPH